MSQITFIGLGNMGAPMAKNLVNADHDVTVFDLNQDAVSALETHGAKTASTARDAVQNAEVVITMLPAAKHVMSVYFDDVYGIASALPQKALVIDCSTIDAQTARHLGATIGGMGIAFLDAPVSGGVGGATDGTLTFIVVGEPDQ